MNRRTFVVAALAWVLVVTLGSGLVWAVVSRAGEGVGSAAAPLGADDGTPDLGRATQAVGQATAGPSSQHSHDDDHGKHHGSGDDKPGDDHGGGGGHATSGPSGDSSPGGTGGTGSTGGSGSTRSSSPAPDPGPTPVSDTWTGSAGSVKVTCTGATIAYDSALPANGYRFEVGDKGPEHVEVEFENTSTERQTKVVATCSSGAPAFRTETDGGDSGSDD